MLKRVTSGRYEGNEGDVVTIVTQSQGNNGVNDARFQYAGNVLPRAASSGLPAGTFTVQRGRAQFEAVVAFDPTADNSARYDVFEVDSTGGLTDLREHLTKLDGSPLLAFAVDGVPVVAAVPKRMPGVAPAAPRAKTAAAKRSKPKAARKKTTGQAAAPKKGARKKVAARKSRVRRTTTRKRR
jgi:hypothetical protein